VILNEQIASLHTGGPGFPQTLLARSCGGAIAELWAAGVVSLLHEPKTGFFCSTQCPGSVVLKTFDEITRMRDDGQILVGGFHSMMESECLGILLRGKQPVIWVPGRSIIGMRLKPELVPAFNTGRLLILSPFPPHHKRITSALAETRNRFIGALVDRVFVPHAAPKSKTMALCIELRNAGKQVLSLDDPELHITPERTPSPDGTHPQTPTR
jgi:hypothetical protein